MNVHNIFLILLLVCTKPNLTWGFCQEESEEKSYIVQRNLSYPYKRFTYNGSIKDCGCTEKVCIRKCCEEDYVFENNRCIYNKTTKSFGVYEEETLMNDVLMRQRVIAGTTKCPNNFYRLDPIETPIAEFYLQKDGQLWIPAQGVFLELDTFCLETTDGNTWALICIPPSALPARFANTLGMLMSMPLLIVTFIVYAILPEKKIHERSLMCYVFSLLIAYMLLCIINFKRMHTEICITIGLTCLYFFTASFFWINAMSIDIWWTIRGSKDYSGNTKASTQKQLFLYSLYAWGVPFILVLIVGLLNAYADSSSWYSPNIGTQVCWIKGGIQQLMYFYAPLALIIVFNLVLYTITAVKIRRTQIDTAMLRSIQFQKHNEEEQQRFKLYIRLSLAMCVNWIMEIVSWAVHWQVGFVPRSFWYLTDLCNVIYGITIFIVFVREKKISLAVKNQCSCSNNERRTPSESAVTAESAM